MKEKTIVLDFTGCKTCSDVHEQIRVAMDFPEWYGANLDAFWDMLRTECDATKLVIKGVESFSKDLNSYMTKIYGILDRCVAERSAAAEKYQQILPLVYEFEDK